MSDTIRLYHYCCTCSARRITARGFLKPNPFLSRLDFGFVWLTDLNMPDREGLGLTAHELSCDRLDCQYVVDVEPARVQHWPSSAVRARLVNDFDFADFERGRRPDTWWIATLAVFAVRNRQYVNPDPVRPATLRVVLSKNNNPIVTGLL